MALMRAKFERCGEPIPMRVEKRDYLFQETHSGDFVAKIDSEDHVNRLLATGNFEIYDEKAAIARAREQWADEIIDDVESKIEKKSGANSTTAGTRKGASK